MKFILEAILVVLGLSVACMFFPALIGIFIGILKFDNGYIFRGIVAIVIGLLVQVLFFLFIFQDSGISFGHSGDDEDCPYCGGGDTDGNHCYSCDDDF